MRVLFWKFHCPSFICFCKSSPLSLPTPCPLDLENTQHVSSTLPSFPNAVEELSNEKVEDEKERVDVQVEDDDVPPRSSLRKPSGSGSREIEKGKVQWMDFLGKELVEIREFEPR